MKKQLLALAMAGAMLLGGCQPTYNENDPNYPGTTQPEQNDTHAIPRIRTTSTIAITA